jgi:hypothetical protein
VDDRRLECFFCVGPYKTKTILENEDEELDVAEEEETI